MFATRRSRVLVLLGLVALVGLLGLRRRRAGERDGVASSDVSEDVVADVGTQPDVMAEAVPAAPVAPITDDLTDETVDDTETIDDTETVAARIYEVSAPPVVEEPVAAEPVAAEPAEEASVAAEPVDERGVPSIDLGRIERDLEGVEAALRRLDEGTYWTDEITGEPIDEALLVADPVARRNVA